jgi:putative Mn2+ efflux pump MntP
MNDPMYKFDGEFHQPQKAQSSPAGNLQTPSQLSLPALLAQAVATSIDAFVVGVSFLAMGVNIFAASSIVALTTFVCCLVALVIGRRFGSLLGDKAQIIGGIVLILIGIKALF